MLDLNLQSNDDVAGCSSRLADHSSTKVKSYNPFRNICQAYFSKDVSAFNVSFSQAMSGMKCSQSKVPPSHGSVIFFILLPL